MFRLLGKEDYSQLLKSKELKRVKRVHRVQKVKKVKKVKRGKNTFLVERNH